MKIMPLPYQKVQKNYNYIAITRFTLDWNFARYVISDMRGIVAIIVSITAFCSFLVGVSAMAGNSLTVDSGIVIALGALVVFIAVYLFSLGIGITKSTTVS